MTLYETLGVQPNASPQVIKEAYRRLAQKHHPDKDGDEATFKAIKAAYEVLSDVERRKRYDETGDSSEAPDAASQARAEAMADLGALLDGVIDGLRDVEAQNPIAAIRDVLRERKMSVRSELGKIEHKIANREKVIGRLRRPKDAPDDVVTALLKGQITSLSAQLLKGEHFFRLCDLVTEMIGSYEYKVEKPQPESSQEAAFREMFGGLFRR